MSTQTHIDLDAISHLPSGGTLILTDIPWEEYEQVLAFLGDSTGIRVTYDNGRLAIMSPSQKHENLTRVIERLVYTIAEEMGVVLESYGSTTYKQELFGRGVEPDACFYTANADRIIGTERIDLSTDPPPDIVVEIDIAHDSTTKFAIYAAMGVPELWHYDDHRIKIYSLVDQRYVEVPVSGSFPVITGEVLLRFVEQSNLVGQTAMVKAFREWLRTERH